MRALLDVNVLVALLDAGHLHHRMAMEWLADNQAQGWASSPSTQNGCLRILSLPAYPNSQAAPLVAQRLGQAIEHAAHEFWTDELSLLTPGALHWDRVLSSRQIADVYLLALAVHRGGRLVTFDQGIPIQAVPGAQKKNLLILS
ncbi:MAG: VapC toxin family PIN domain ribonuclease [Methylibium sp.]|nr:VapC toxin family PIN domain ribonuclease [Methylibium sp.]